MNHWVIAPIVGPLLVAVLLLLAERRGTRLLIAATGTLLGVALVMWMLGRSLNEGMETYLPGNIAAPPGIVLVLDKLASLLLVLIALMQMVTLAALVSSGRDRTTPMVLVSQQVMVAGLNGAVLAGDVVSLWLLWTLALAGLCGLDPAARPVAVAGAALLGGTTLVLIWATGCNNLAEMAEGYAAINRPGATTAVLMLGLALWLTGFRAALRSPLAAAFAVAAAAIVGRVLVLVPPSPAAALGAAGLGAAGLGAAAVAIWDWRRERPPAGALLTGLCATLALCLIGQTGDPAAKLGVWALIAGCAALIVTQGAGVIGQIPVLRRSPALGLALCFGAAIALGTAAGVGAIAPARLAAQPGAISRQLHTREIYIVAVMGLPDDPALATGTGF